MNGSDGRVRAGDFSPPRDKDGFLAQALAMFGPYRIGRYSRFFVWRASELVVRNFHFGLDFGEVRKRWHGCRATHQCGQTQTPYPMA